MKNNEENIISCNKAGYNIIANFILPETDWWDDFYSPLETRVKILRDKQENNEQFLQFLDSIRIEIEFYRKYSDYYGYAFYIMQKY
jgi:hypothetical protein